MNTIRIYREKEVIYEFIAENSFTRPWALMGDNYVSISLKVKEDLSLLFGDYIILDDETFTLFNAINITETDGIKEYPLTFYSKQYFANRCIIEDEGATTFPYFGGVKDHVKLIELAFEKYGIPLSFGEVEENGSQLINYDNTKGLDGISKICEAFKLEWECIGGIFSLKKRIGVDTSYRFEYGKGKGAYSVGLQPIQNTSIATRIIAKGGTINLPKDYLSTDTPKRLNLGTKVLDRNTDKYGIIPEVLINEDIYPRLIDKKVLSVEVPADIENATVWKLKLDIPFDLAAQYVPDQKPEVKFQTGDLTGESFEIAENSWNNTEKTLQIIVKDEDGYRLPSANRQPRIGDEFVLLNILMPETPYVTDATAELKSWGQEQLKTLSEPQYAPSLSADPAYIKANNIQLRPGDGIVIMAGGNEIHIRVQKITFPLADTRQLNFELGNNIMYSYEEKVANDLQDITSEVQNIRRNVQNVDRRGWRDAKETNERLNGIEESAALIGTEGGQLTFSGMFQANVNSNPNLFHTTAGRLQHFIYKDNPTKGIWNIGVFNISLSEDVLYSIYAKCDKSTANGIIYVSKEKIDVEAEAGYYYFFLGTISSVFENARSITLVTGYTSITGGYLTGQVIKDARGRLVIDMPNARITAHEGATIEGKITFSSGSSGLKNLDEWADAETSIQNAQDAANQAQSDLENYRQVTNETLETLHVVTDDLQSQVDGNIMAWEGSDVPTLSNYPASEWTTDKEKERHKGDYYDRFFMQDGEKVTERYKFTQENGTYQWTQIADSSSSLALQKAREALGLAGTKARLFYGDSVPTAPYDINDAWWKANGTTLLSKAKRLEGYGQNSDDWEVVNDTQVRLAQMVSDNVISREEKASLRNEKSQIDKEYTKYQSDATKYGVSITSLQTAYTALVNFLNDTVRISEDSDFTFSGLAQQSQYNQLFADYYTARTDFANLIADKITSQAVGGIQIGETNLLDNSNKGFKNSNYLIATYHLGDYKPKEGEECTIVMKCKLGVGKNSFDVYNSGGKVRLDTIPRYAINSDGIAVSTFKWKLNSEGNIYINIYALYNDVVVESEIEWVKMVSGNKTSLMWMPSLNDQRQIAREEGDKVLEGIQIGGVNLLNGSMTGTGWIDFTRHEGTEFSKDSMLSTESHIYSGYIKIPGNKEIVVSFYAKHSGNIPHNFEFYILPDDYNFYGLLQKYYTSGEEWQYNEFKFKTPSTWGSGDSIIPVRFRLDHNGSAGGELTTVFIKDVQIEYGNKATTYSVPEADREEIAKQQGLAGGQEAVNGLQIGSQNLISKKMMLKWNEKNKDIAVWGRDADGVYIGVVPRFLYENIAGNNTLMNPVFNISFKEDTQYVFSVEWKTATTESTVKRGLFFIVCYTDGTTDEIALFNNVVNKTRRDYISRPGKTVQKISASYGNGGINALIYNISLIEGNKPLNGFPVAQEDQTGASNVNLADGTKEFTVTAGESNYGYIPLPVRIKPNTVYHVQAENIENIAGSPTLYTFALYDKSDIINFDYWSYNKNGGILITSNNFVEQDGHLLCYAGVAGQTAGNTVKFTKVMLLEGFLPAATWSPSANDLNALAKQIQAELAQWAADNKISPVEKTGLRQQLSEIQAAYSDLTSRAATYSATNDTVYTAYISAYNAAVSALNKYTASSPEIINVEADYNNISAYYAKEQSLKELLEKIVNSHKIITTIDASGLDQNTYYPVIMSINLTTRASFKVSAGLWNSGIPSWSTHEGGFACECSWEANASGWGAISVNRYIYSFAYRYTKEYTTSAGTKDWILPIGSVGQMSNSSSEYIYVRGGGKYRFETTSVNNISLKTAAYTASNETISPKTTVEKPVVTVDAVADVASAADRIARDAEKVANSASSIASAAQSAANTANSAADAAKKSAEAAATRAQNLEYLKSALTNDTSVEGGLVATSLLKVGAVVQSGKWVEAAGINGTGTATASIRFYAGGDLESAIRLVNNTSGTKATFAVTKAGQLFATNAKITGEVIATSGSFTGAIQSSVNGNRFVIDPSGDTPSFKMISSSNKLLANMTFWNDDVGGSITNLQMHNYLEGIFGTKCSTHLTPVGLAIYDGINESILLGSPAVELSRYNFKIKHLPQRSGSNRDWRTLYFDRNSGDIRWN